MNAREMRKNTKRQDAYLSKYEARIYGRDKTVPTYAQYLQKEFNEKPKVVKKTVRQKVKQASGFDWDRDKPSARLRKRK